VDKFGINHCKDSAYGAAAALTYWVFRCRDKQKSPAMGTKTWTFLESSIQNSAETATCLEDYLQSLSDRLISHLRPAELTWVVYPPAGSICLPSFNRFVPVNCIGSPRQTLLKL